MSYYIKDTFARMDLQQIREFLMYGTELDEKEAAVPYEIRLKNASDPIYKRINSLYPEIDEHTKACNDIAQAITAFEEVYMEIGMKAGARLIYQLLLSDNPSLLAEGGTT